MELFDERKQTIISDNPPGKSVKPPTRESVPVRTRQIYYCDKTKQFWMRPNDGQRINSLAKAVRRYVNSKHLDITVQQSGSIVILVSNTYDINMLVTDDHFDNLVIEQALLTSSTTKKRTTKPDSGTEQHNPQKRTKVNSTASEERTPNPNCFFQNKTTSTINTAPGADAEYVAYFFAAVSQEEQTGLEDKNGTDVLPLSAFTWITK